MKFVLFLALATCATVASFPQGEPQDQGFDQGQVFSGNQQLVTVLQDTREGPVEANFNNVLELDNGVKIEESGTAGSAGQANVRGSYAFTAPDGTAIVITYVADENGFQPQSDALPVDHPLPAHVQDLLRIADEQKAQGVQFDDKGFRI